MLVLNIVGVQLPENKKRYLDTLLSIKTEAVKYDQWPDNILKKYYDLIETLIFSPRNKDYKESSENQNKMRLTSCNYPKP